MFGTLKYLNVSLLALGLVASGSSLGSVSAAPSAQPAAQNWTAKVGHGIVTQQGEKASWQVMRFYPATMTINAGDAITWRFDAGEEPHTVTFLGPEKAIPPFVAGPPPGAGGEGGPPAGGPPPALPEKIPANPMVAFKQGPDTYDGTAYVSSGFISSVVPRPKDYKLTFPKAGTYEYVCALHAFQDPATGEILGMKARVVVQEAGSALPKTQAQLDADVAAQVKADEAKAAELMPQVNQNAVTTTQGPNGTAVHKVNVGYFHMDPAFPLEYERFSPGEITINVGDTVEWAMPNVGFHTVTFGREIELEDFSPQPSGEPGLFLNVAAIAPAGTNTHSGTGFYSSGILLAEGEEPLFPFPQVQTYALGFAQEGRFEYICTVHYHQGMDGTVVVRARTGAGTGQTGGQAGGAGTVGMPRTGAGSDWMIGAALMALVLATTGLVLRRRQNSVI